MLNTKLKQSGFTIVELLIVIVVIAILAAISIVAYNGIQNRGKTSAAQSLASQIAKKAEAWNTIQSSYPTFANLKTNNTNAKGTGVGADCGTANCAGTTAGPLESKLDNPSQISQSTTPTDEKTVGYQVCVESSNNVGFIIYYRNAINSSTATITGGKTTGGPTCA
jgi:prepilin-type N-terminal cleavage/methylation domain-containing protein